MIVLVLVLVRADGELVVRSFKHGQSNPTYYVKFGGRELVLRKKPVSLLFSPDVFTSTRTSSLL